MISLVTLEGATGDARIEFAIAPMVFGAYFLAFLNDVIRSGERI